MPYSQRVFVSFDGDSDMHFYCLMKAWKQSDNTPFWFDDAHDLNYARDTSQEELIKRQLSIRLRSSQVFVSLVGQSTRYLYKFVRWEIEQAIRLDLPIIVVNLNGLRTLDWELCPPLLREAHGLHIPFGSKVLQHALEHWPSEYRSIPQGVLKDWYYFAPEVYSRLGV